MNRREPHPRVFHGTTLGNRITTCIVATRPSFFSASLLPVLVAFAFAWAEYGRIYPALSIATLAAIVLIHAAANVLNDYFDARNGSDANNTGRIFPYTGGSRFIQNNVLTPLQTLRLGTILLCAGIALGVALVAASGPMLFLIGLVGVAIAFFYSSPPCLACHGLGDLAVGTCFGVLPVLGAMYVQGYEPELRDALLGFAIGCFAAAILWVNSIPDIEADRTAGKNTLPARLGARRARWGLFLLFVTGLGIISLAPLPFGVLGGWLAALPAGLAVLRIFQGRTEAAIVHTIAAHTVFCLSIALAFTVSGTF